jgi:hypothetical protein
MDRPLSIRDIARIVAGAVASLVIVGWIMFVAFALLSPR